MVLLTSHSAEKHSCFAQFQWMGFTPSSNSLTHLLIYHNNMGKGKKRAPLRKPEQESKAQADSSDEEEEEQVLAPQAKKAKTQSNNGNKKGVKKGVQKGREGDSSSDSDSDSDSDDDLALDGGQGDVVDMSFDFNDMKEEYSYGVAKMLKHLNSNEPDALKLAEVICKQDVVGTAVCCDEGDDVFAYATVLPLQSIKEDENFGPIISDLLTACTKIASGENRDTLLRHLSGDKCASTGLFLHGRYINLPLQLCGALHSNLVEDLAWSKANNNEEDAKFFKEMDHVLVLVPCAMESGQEVPKLGCVDITGNNSVMFDAFEDDVYFQESLCTYAFKSSNSESTLAGVLVPVKELSKCITQIQAMTAV